MFFKNLKILGTGTLNYNKIAKAVYKELGQKDNLMAEVLLVSEEEIQELNKNTRGIDKVTDVLSFPTLEGVRGKVLYCNDHPFETEGNRLHIGSVVICAAQGARQAVEFGHSEEREYTYLLIHGLLHLFGYDHMEDEDKKQMRSIEKSIIKKLKLTIVGEEE